MKNHEEQILKSLKYHPEREPREEAKEQLKKELRKQVYKMERKKSFMNITNIAMATIASIASIFIVVLMISSNYSELLPSAFKRFLGISENEGERIEQPIEEDQEIPEELYVEETTKEGMEKLFNDLSLQLFEWSPDGKKVIFSTITFEDNVDFADLFVWVVGENKPKKMDTLQVSLTTSFVWSPDSEKVIVSLGTSAQRESFIIHVNKREIMGSFVNFGMEVWSPDSSQIAFASINRDVRDNGLTELSGSLNLAIYDFKYGITELLYGTEEYYYMPNEWTDKNKLKYSKYYFETGQEKQGELNPIMKDREKSLIEELPGMKPFADQLNDFIPEGLRTTDSEYPMYEEANDILYWYLLAIYYELEDALEQTREYMTPYESFEQLVEMYKKNVDFNTIRLNHVRLDDNRQMIEYHLTYDNQITGNFDSLIIKYDLTNGSLNDLNEF